MAEEYHWDVKEQGMYPLQVSREQRIREIAIAHGVKENSLAKIASRFDLEEHDIHEVALLKKDYHASTQSLLRLIAQGRNLMEIRVLYDLREEFGRYYALKEKGGEVYCLTHMSELWDTFYGGDIDMDLLGDMMYMLAMVRPELRLDKKAKLAVEIGKRDGCSLEHICDTLEQRCGFTEEDMELTEFLINHAE